MTYTPDSESTDRGIVGECVRDLKESGPVPLYVLVILFAAMLHKRLRDHAASAAAVLSCLVSGGWCIGHGEFAGLSAATTIAALILMVTSYVSSDSSGDYSRVILDRAMRSDGSNVPVLGDYVMWRMRFDGADRVDSAIQGMERIRQTSPSSEGNVIALALADALDSVPLAENERVELERVWNRERLYDVLKNVGPVEPRMALARICVSVKAGAPENFVLSRVDVERAFEIRKKLGPDEIAVVLEHERRRRNND